MAWGPLSMAIGETQNGERVLFSKGSFKTKSHSYSWIEDEGSKDFGWSKGQGGFVSSAVGNAIPGPGSGVIGGLAVDEGRRHTDKIRDIASLAEKLGCSATQLSIAWTLKHEPVQCLLLGATSAEQLHQSLQALQVYFIIIIIIIIIFFSKL